jgi:hypothetical protein
MWCDQETAIVQEGDVTSKLQLSRNVIRDKKTLIVQECDPWQEHFNCPGSVNKNSTGPVMANVAHIWPLSDRLAIVHDTYNLSVIPWYINQADVVCRADSLP